MKNRVIAVLIVLTLLLAALPAYAATGKVTTRTTTNLFDAYNASSKAWNELKTAQHRLSSSHVAYCLQHKKAVPNSETYNLDDLYDNYSDRVKKGLQIIVTNGYPWETGGLTAAQAEYATANAVRFWLSECGDSEFYNMTNLKEFSDSQLRTLAASGTITKKIRVRDNAYIPALQFAVELLIKARAQKVLTHDVTLDAGVSNIQATLSGSEFTGSTAVTVTNLRGGYTLDKSGLPSGSTVTGYTGKGSETITIHIPANAATANQTYTLAISGRDDRCRASIAAIGHGSDASYQRVMSVHIGASWYTEVLKKTFTVTTGDSAPHIDLPKYPDLVITELKTDKPSYAPGEAVTVTAKVKNDSDQACGAFDTSLSDSNGASARTYSAGLGAGNVTTLTWQWNAPAEAGTFTLIAFADCNRDIAESNENNNTRSASAVVVAPPAADPDLVVSELKTNKASYTAGEVIIVTAKVKNDSDQACGAFYTSITDATGASSLNYCGGLDAGGTTSMKQYKVAPDMTGTFSFTAFADCEGAVYESNENNNTASVSVAIAAPPPVYPDLVITELKTDRSSYVAGEKIVITATVKNDSEMDCGAFYTSLTDSGDAVARTYSGGLAAGDATTLTWQWNAPPAAGSLSFTAFADCDRAVQESSEDNNQRTTSVTIVAPSFPDLTVTSVVPTASSYTAGTAVTIYSTIENIGNLDAGAFVVKFSPEGLTAQTQTLTGLKAGEQTKLKWTFSAPAFTQTTQIPVRVEADSTGAVSESNEGNNTGTGSATVIGEKPDLRIDSLTPDAETYLPRERVTITAVVHNNAVVPCPASRLRLSGDGFDAQVKDVPALNGGGSASVTFSFSAPHAIDRKAFNLTAMADPDNLIEEYDESNNRRAGSYVVYNPLPDLTVTKIRASKDEYEEDESGRVTVTVVNQGSKSVDSSRLRLTLGDFFSETKTTGMIAAGSAAQVTFDFVAPATLARMTVTATATTDPGNEIEESNENNNTLTGALAVRPVPPDLAVVSTNAANWYAGKDIVVTATIVNYTKKDVPSATVRLTLGSRQYEEVIPIPGNGTNLAVFRVKLPGSPGAAALSFVVDPLNDIPEGNEDNNDLDRTVEIVAVPPGVVLDPDLEALETNYRTNGLLSLPNTANSDYHIWQEVRLEDGAYLTKTYWAQLQTVFSLTPDPRVAYPSEPTRMESGFGVQVSLQTKLTTNYDHPEKLVGVQMVWTFSPETGYGKIAKWSGAFDALQTASGSPGSKTSQWRYAVNPWSASGSRLHYTPLWFPDGQYTVLSQAFYAWSPAGQMYWYDAGSVDIRGDMYDRVTAIQER